MHRCHVLIRVGTSGFSYRDWKDVFYPRSLSQGELLEYYADHFGTVELNFSYYLMPSADGLEKMIKKTSGGIIFCLKAHRSITHDRDAGRGDFDRFRDACAPVNEAGLLGAVLLQFPYSFHRNSANRKYLDETTKRMEQLPMVVEFRNSGWLNPETFEGLRNRDIGFCCVDEPRLRGLLPAVKEVTGPVAYVRFHGRNSEKWYNHEHSWERYNYVYDSDEIREWVPEIIKMDKKAKEVFVFFNNHYKAKAVDSAKLLKKLLETEQA